MYIPHSPLSQKDSLFVHFVQGRPLLYGLVRLLLKPNTYTLLVNVFARTRIAAKHFFLFLLDLYFCFRTVQKTIMVELMTITV
jgi:hypothetical protein